MNYPEEYDDPTLEEEIEEYEEGANDAVFTLEKEDVPEKRMAHRYYENEYPEPEECVVVQVKNIENMGAYVQLLEYNNVEGMILLSELSRRRIRSVNRLIRVGRNEIVMVLRVDKEKVLATPDITLLLGYIDLSKRRVSPEDIQACEERFQKSKMVHGILAHTSKVLNLEIDDLYRRVAWPLARKFGHALDGFKSFVANPSEAFIGMDVNEELKNELLQYVESKLTPTATKIRCDFDLSCFSYQGVEAIKEALRAAESVGTEECPVKTKLVAPPLYVMVTTTLNKEAGLEKLNEACEVMKEKIEVHKGSMKIRHAPRVVNEKDDKLLSAMMERAEAEQRQIDGDEYESDED